MFTHKTPEDEAFEDLERALNRAKASIPPFQDQARNIYPQTSTRHPADVQTEYNLYKKGVQDLQQKLAELEASYSIVCSHGVKLETALANTKRQLDQCQKSWLTALLFRLGLMK
jgi:hypothetical protein